MTKTFFAVLCVLALLAPVAVTATDGSVLPVEEPATSDAQKLEAPSADPTPELADPSADAVFASDPPPCWQVEGNYCRQEGATQYCLNPPLLRVCECQGFSWNCSF